MQESKLLKSGLLALVLVLSFIVGWELFWRNRGFQATFNDDKALWANSRKEAYRPQANATVFIGSSRIKFDLDIPTWEATTGEKAVQLSVVGTSPLTLLEELANDENFNGKVVTDITEVLFFPNNPVFHQSAKEAIDFYKNQTPSEKLSSQVNYALESKLAFLEERRFSLNALLNEVPLQNRPGVFAMPVFPKGFEWTTYDRQTFMSDMFLSDTNDINKQTGIWSMLLMGDPTPPPTGADLTQIFERVKTSVDKINNRGGKVIFIRTPSSGPLAEAEEKKYPRNAYWDKLLAHVKTEGIHYRDYASTKNLECPEWSHLAIKDAVIYTHELISILREKNWFAAKELALTTTTN
ncbi:hypothetical protein [Flavihumibacter solisilvae]|uniref:Uncharacterized protein n=1 Tax=Flavihumibacter solisilvae TaxID=1349421 RepID=A0A0C1L2H2_9BACT|nr:hypothetical protein [Flavihumibacter solisilvae]KIC94202.1 hypothetical protein OI18_13420 [Flavihumibacter solisilvae]